MRRVFRIGGTLMMVAGALAIGWALLVWQWQDPFTNLYTRWQQHKLADRYARVLKAYKPPSLPAKQKAAAPAPRTRKGPPSSSSTSTSWVAAERREIALEAKHYRLQLHQGDPVGRLKVPRLGLSVIVVNGTDRDSLTKGPGRYLGTYMPGEHELVYVAGHRTTYLAPFAHIDALRPGDRATFELPYATFVYEIRWHSIVAAGDIGRLRSHHHEVLALQACHPRFFATHRYIAYAILVRVEPRNGRSYTLIHSRLAASSSA
jgi:sortase A